MLASLAGCTGIDVVMLLDKMKASFSDFSIDVEAELSADHPKIYTHVTLVYRIRMKEAERPKMEKAVQMSQGKILWRERHVQSFCQPGSRDHLSVSAALYLFSYPQHL